MWKFISIVSVAYVIYYLGVIGYQLLTGGPGTKKEKQKEVYSVSGSAEDDSEETPVLVNEDDVEFSEEATTALKKN